MNFSFQVSISTNCEKARKLYWIIYGRKGAFLVLRDALELTRQTGALDIISQFFEDDVSSVRTQGAIEYDSTAVIGRGAFGSIVHKGLFENHQVAVKKVYTDNAYFTSLQTEIDIMRRTPRHQNILEYRHHEQCSKYWLIAYEYCQFSLESCVKGQECLSNQLGILRQITLGLNFLHSKCIIHGDLRPTNILLSISNNQFCVKLTDFGGSAGWPRKCYNVITLDSLYGTFCWRPPEVLNWLVGKTDSSNLVRFKLEN